MTRPWSIGRRGVLAGVAVLVLLSVNVGLNEYRQTHPVLPGLGGCRTVVEDRPHIACIERHLISSIRASDSNALVTLARIDAGDPTSRFQDGCHQAAHGTAAWYVRTRRGAEEMIATALDRTFTGQCAYGFVHGIIERLVATEPEAAVSFGARVCEVAATDAGALNCFHGIGHGLQRGDGTIAQNRSRCARLGQGNEDCLSGHMERAFQVTETTDPASMCSDVARVDAWVCGFYVPTALVATDRSSSAEQSLDYCVAELTGVVEQGCVEAASAALELDKIEVCAELGRRELQTTCATQVAVASLGRGTKLRDVVAACDELDAPLRDRCRTARA